MLDTRSPNVHLAIENGIIKLSSNLYSIQLEEDVKLLRGKGALDGMIPNPELERCL